MSFVGQMMLACVQPQGEDLLRPTGWLQARHRGVWDHSACTFARAEAIAGRLANAGAGHGVFLRRTVAPSPDHLTYILYEADR